MGEITSHVLKSLLHDGSFCGSYKLSATLGPVLGGEGKMQIFHMWMKTPQSLILCTMTISVSLLTSTHRNKKASLMRAKVCTCR